MTSRELPINLETFAAGLRETFVSCRELGHLWRPNAVSWDASARAYDRTLRCSRCRAERVQVVSEHGHVVSSRYRYPDGYQAHNVERGTYTRDVFRVESIKRFLAKDESK